MTTLRPAHVVALFLVAVATSCAASRERAPAAPAATDPAASPGPEVHHEAQVTLVPAREAVLVEDEVTLSPALRARAGDRVVFTLHAGLSPERIGGAPLVAVPEGPTPRPAEERSDVPGVPVEHFAVALAPGERTFTVRYGGRVYHPIEERGEEYARKMAESPGLVSNDGAVLSGSTRWLPELSGGLLSFALDVRVPAGWEVVSQGARTRHEREAGGLAVRWESPEPQEEAYLVAGPLTEHARGGGRVAVQAFLREGGDAALAERYLAAGAAVPRDLRAG